MVDLSWPKYAIIDRYKDGRDINNYLDTVPELVVTDKSNPKGNALVLMFVLQIIAIIGAIIIIYNLSFCA